MHRLKSVVIAGVALLIVATVLWFALGVDWMVNHGRDLVEQREHTAALAWLQRAADWDADNAEIAYQLARVQRRLGHLELAEQELQRAAELGLDDDLIDRERMLLTLKRGEYPTQIEIWRQLTQAAGSDGPEISEAFVYFRLSRFETKHALAILDAWQADYPNDAQPHHLRGQVFRVIERSRDAIEEFRQAAELDPQSDAILYDLATMYMDQLAYVDAIDVLRRCTALDPENHEAQALLARGLRKTGETQAAQALLQTELSHDPNNATVLRELGELQLIEGNFDEAVQSLSQAVASEPVDRELRYLLAQAFQRAGRTTQADEEYAFVKEATEATTQLPKLLADLVDDPGNVDLRYQVALTNWKYKSREIGLRWFQELLSVAPQHAPTHRILAEYYAQQGDLRRAEHHRQLAAKGSGTH